MIAIRVLLVETARLLGLTVKLVQAGFWANHFGDLSGTFGGIMCAA